MLKATNFQFEFRLQRSTLLSCVIGGLLLLSSGCTRQGKITPLDLDPELAASKAIAAYDKDSNAALSKSEIAEVPSLLSAFSGFDQDSDKSISKAELVARFKMWTESSAGVVRAPTTIWLDNQPLVGAEVEFDPESFLSDSIPPAKGVTSSGGHLMPSISKDKLPAQFAKIDVMRLGLYRVRVTHPSKKIPAIYNSNTTLGVEIHPGTLAGATEFRLKSK